MKSFLRVKSSATIISSISCNVFRVLQIVCYTVLEMRKSTLRGGVVAQW